MGVVVRVMEEMVGVEKVVVMVAVARVEVMVAEGLEDFETQYKCTCVPQNTIPTAFVGTCHSQ